MPQQYFWIITCFNREYYFSPYLILNGVGLIISLLILDNVLNFSFNIERNKIYSLYVFSIVAGWVGAHFFDFIVKYPQLNSHAGFTFYGGFLSGLIFFCMLFLYFFNKKNLLQALDAGVIPLIVAQAIGRVGCYFSGCCYGKAIKTTNFFTNFFDRHPTQLYESAFLICILIIIYLKNKYKVLILNIYVYIFCYGFFRFFIEFLRDDYRGVYLLNLSPSQWISTFLVLFCLLTYLNYLARNRAKLKD